MRVAVCIPYRDGGPDRELAWHYVQRWWGQRFEVFSATGGDGPMMNRSRARNQAAVDAGDWDLAIFGDADTVGEHRFVDKAIATARDTGQLTYPFTRYQALDKVGTKRLIAGQPPQRIRRRLENSPGGILCVRRDLYERVGGWDEAFEGWGYEDVAFAIAAGTLGGVTRYPGTITHLWHPNAPEKRDAIAGKTANRRRVARYKQAEGDPEKMEALLSELRS